MTGETARLENGPDVTCEIDARRGVVRAPVGGELKNGGEKPGELEGCSHRIGSWRPGPASFISGPWIPAPRSGWRAAC